MIDISEKKHSPWFLHRKESFVEGKISLPYDSILNGSFTEANKMFDCNFSNPYVLTNTSFPTQRIEVYASRNT